MTDIEKIIMKADMNELAEIRRLCDLRARQLAVRLVCGSWVKFTGRRGQTIVGQVERVNKKSVSVRNCSDGRGWRVSPQLLTQCNKYGDVI